MGVGHAIVNGLLLVGAIIWSIGVWGFAHALTDPFDDEDWMLGAWMRRHHPWATMLWPLAVPLGLMLWLRSEKRRD